MSFSRKSFDKAVWDVVSSIEAGHVMSYGDVARIAGYPRHARMVSRAMYRSVTQLPWHRVVKSDRSLAFKPGSESYNKQKKLLEREGVYLLNGKAVTTESDDAADIDKLLWGPPD